MLFVAATLRPGLAAGWGEVPPASEVKRVCGFPVFLHTHELRAPLALKRCRGCCFTRVVSALVGVWSPEINADAYHLYSKAEAVAREMKMHLVPQWVLQEAVAASGRSLGLLLQLLPFGILFKAATYCNSPPLRCSENVDVAVYSVREERRLEAVEEQHDKAEVERLRGGRGQAEELAATTNKVVRSVQWISLLAIGAFSAGIATNSLQGEAGEYLVQFSWFLIFVKAAIKQGVSRALRRAEVGAVPVRHLHHQPTKRTGLCSWKKKGGDELGDEEQPGEQDPDNDGDSNSSSADDESLHSHTSSLHPGRATGQSRRSLASNSATNVGQTSDQHVSDAPVAPDPITCARIAPFTAVNPDLESHDSDAIISQRAESEKISIVATLPDEFQEHLAPSKETLNGKLRDLERVAGGSDDAMVIPRRFSEPLDVYHTAVSSGFAKHFDPGRVFDPDGGDLHTVAARHQLPCTPAVPRLRPRVPPLDKKGRRFLWPGTVPEDVGDCVGGAWSATNRAKHLAYDQLVAELAAQNPYIGYRDLACEEGLLESANVAKGIRNVQLLLEDDGQTPPPSAFSTARNMRCLRLVVRSRKDRAELQRLVRPDFRLRDELILGNVQVPRWARLAYGEDPLADGTGMWQIEDIGLLPVPTKVTFRLEDQPYTICGGCVQCEA
mmetsp:Transcript_4217/g.8676  ORF Transcript_4217/g.8676 Transcript_4217/m.8676 type:complete len:667 (+) Transcript_4217:1-2001(+)